MQTAFARNGYAVKCRNIIVRRCHCHFEREPRNLRGSAAMAATRFLHKVEMTMILSA